MKRQLSIYIFFYATVIFYFFIGIITYLNKPTTNPDPAILGIDIALKSYSKGYMDATANVSYILIRKDDFKTDDDMTKMLDRLYERDSIRFRKYLENIR